MEERVRKSTLFFYTATKTLSYRDSLFFSAFCDPVPKLIGRNSFSRLYFWNSIRKGIKLMMQRSVLFGGLIGAVLGVVIGAGLGAITTTLNGVLVGAVAGLVLGILDGALVAALTVRTAGTTGGVSVGAYTGMGFGAIIGGFIGAFLPKWLLMSAQTEGMPVLDALVIGRFETIVLFAFLLCVLGTMVGAWVSGQNLFPKNTKS
jgi:hypothetical protein